MEDQKGDSQVEYDIVVTERDALMDEKKTVEASRKATQAELDKHKVDLSESQTTIQELAKELGSDSSQKATLLAAVTQFRSQLATLEAAMATKANDRSHEEAIDDLQSSHAIEVGQRDSRIRQLEQELHAETSRAHSMAKNITDIQAEFASLRSQADNISLPSPSISRRPLNSPRTSSFTPTGPSIAVPAASIDASLPPSMRHKRHVSLAMLKARMSGPPPSLTRESSTAIMSVVSEDDGEEERAEHQVAHVNGRFASQISDEAVFWCPQCVGGLITL